MLAIGTMAALLLAGCGKKRTPQYVHIGPDSLPTKSYERVPEERFNRSDYVIKLKQMTSFYDVPGEAGYFMNGEDYGFDALSFLLTETQPGGGPPLHTHDSEESHIVLHGQVEYVIGDRDPEDIDCFGRFACFSNNARRGRIAPVTSAQTRRAE